MNVEEINKIIKKNNMIKRVFSGLEDFDNLCIAYVLKNNKIEEVIAKNIIYYNKHKKNSLETKEFADNFLEWFIDNLKKTIKEIERGYSSDIKKDNFIKAVRNEQ